METVSLVILAESQSKEREARAAGGDLAQWQTLVNVHKKGRITLKPFSIKSLIWFDLR